MNVTDFTYLLQNPNETTTLEQTTQLEDILTEFPYFQAARAVHLKGLKNLNSFKYNNALKITAAYTTDRDILFDFITSEDFLQNKIANSISGKTTTLEETVINNLEEIVPPQKEEITIVQESADKPLPQNSIDAAHILDPNLFKASNLKENSAAKQGSQKTEKTTSESEKQLEIGKPLPFTKQEKHSFTEWLQHATKKTIQRDTDNKTVDNPKADFKLEKQVLKQKKFDLIDKFIAESPKIIPKENPATKIETKQASKFDAKELMTETLAKVYLEQKKYKKAIQAYRILSLKYPEKSGFFADRIKSVEKIQQENT